MRCEPFPRGVRLQPSCSSRKCFCSSRVDVSVDSHVRHGVPPSPSSMSGVDDQAGEPALRRRAQALDSWTQASRANQA
jgi:hypothetical protein